MKHLLLKFNHGVEIGARLAYLGHYEATNDTNILSIATDELRHRYNIKAMLTALGEQPSWIFDTFFLLVGTLIGRLCLVFPKSWLNTIARCMEVFAVINYRRLAKIYPRWEKELLEMAQNEDDHNQYFRVG